MYHYGPEYAQHYIESTLGSPYTVYKNKVLAHTLNKLGSEKVWDFGGNVSGLMKIEGSLRYQVEKQGINYGSLDIAQEYFRPDFADSIVKDKSKIYGNIQGITADLRHTPLADNSVASIVCADVIEHIQDPELAMSEIYRVLMPGGNVLLVVPSLYKLDAIKPEHVAHKRVSTHESKFSHQEWLTLCSNASFTIDHANSKPLGIASGLLYLAWLNPNYVPVKTSADDAGKYSPEAQSFQNIKNLISGVDEQIDNLLLDNPVELDIVVNKLLEGDVREVLYMILKWYEQTSHFTSEQLSEFVETFRTNQVSILDLENLQKLILLQEGLAGQHFLCNSCLMVLRKSNSSIG